MSDAPKVSVMVPIYKTNRAYLASTIESVLNQTFRDFELLLLDDCPEEPREDVVRKYDDPRIVYVKNERNLGISESRNKLLDMARGDYVAVLDHDDICYPERFAKEVAYLDAHPDVGVVGAWTRKVPGDHVMRHPTEDADIRLGMMEGCAVAHTTAMMRLSVLRQTGICYQERFSPSEDMAIMLDIMKVAKLHNLPEVLVDYRWHADNTSKHQVDKMTAAVGALFEYAKRNFPELFAMHRALTRTVAFVRLLGIPFLRIERTGLPGWNLRYKVKLFGVPVLRVKVTTRLPRGERSHDASPTNALPQSTLVKSRRTL